MQDISILFKKVKLIIVFIFLILFSSIPNYSQGLQIDLSFGFDNSTPKFHHNSPVILNSTYLEGLNSHSYTIGLTKKIRNNFYLRTEIGLVLTNLSLSLSYNYDEGFGNEHNNLITPFYNERMHLGIIPEYRIKYDIIDFFINGGILISSNLNNEFTAEYNILGANKTPIIGTTLNGGININIGKLAFKFGIEYMSFTKTKLINFYHPYISYTNIGGKFGVVYSLEK